MTHGVDVEEFRQGFLAEADENLARISTALAAIEREPKRAHARELGELIRALHTLKGLAGMMGIEPIVELSHVMETRVRAFQQAGAPVPPAALDPLVVGTRELGQRVRSVAERAAVARPPEALLVELARPIDEPTGPRPAEVQLGGLPADVREKLSPSDLAELAQATTQGELTACVRFVPTPEKAARGASITAVRSGIERVARIVRVVPRSRPRDEHVPGGLEFVIVAAGRVGLDALAESAGVPVGDVEPLVAIAPPPPPPPASEPEPALEPAGRRGIVRVDVARLDVAVELLAAITHGRTRMHEQIRELAGRGVDVRALQSRFDDDARVLRRLRGALVELRMVPLREIVEPLPLMIRGLRASTGKDVGLVLDVGAVELDKSVAERLLPSLIHLMRNAVDHGIEAAERRRAAGKPEQGTISVRAVASSTTHLDIEVTDDGGGIDRRLVEAKHGRPIGARDDELLEVLTSPGFSTRDAVSTTSGRGVGLDVVRRAIEALGGTLELDNRPGQGTTWRLRAPLTVALVDAFACEASDQRYLVPCAAVEAIVEIDELPRIEPPRTDGAHGTLGMLSTRGKLVPLVALGDALGMRVAHDDRKALLVQVGRQQCAFGVTRMLGRHEVIVRPLADPLVQRVGVAGSADLGDGRPTLVLDLRALGQRITRRSEPAVGVAS